MEMWQCGFCGVWTDPAGATGAQANREEADARSVFVGNVISCSPLMAFKILTYLGHCCKSELWYYFFAWFELISSECCSWLIPVQAFDFDTTSYLIYLEIEYWIRGQSLWNVFTNGLCCLSGRLLLYSWRSTTTFSVVRNCESRHDFNW